jgi:hypothetical protein
VSFLQTAVIALSVGVLVAACSTPKASWDDRAMEVEINGQRYRGIGADNFLIDVPSLSQVEATAQPPTGLKPEIFRFSDIPPARVFLMFAVDGTAFVFVPSTVLTGLPAPSAEGSDPLAGRIPELCSHWRSPKPTECE